MKERNSSDPLKSLEAFVRKAAEADNIDPSKAVHIFHLILSESSRGGLSDDDIESMTGYKQSEIRRVLRLLEDYGIAVHRRKRHPEKEVARYFWRVDADSINIVLLNRKKMVLQKLKERLVFEEANTFYVCPHDGSRYTLEEALKHDYLCPRCGSVLEEDSRSAGVEKLREKIRRLEEEIARDERRLYGY
ncbi:MAG: transcription factor [Desulfurococcales archaeon]|nr:transcription factor [Desulfurococcales archaeon]